MPTPLPPKDHRIKLEDALSMREQYRKLASTGVRTPTLSFHRDAYDRILAQPGCVAIRAYPVARPDGTQSVVLVGVDEKGADIIGELAEDSVDCPPECDETSPLAGAG
jgi:hypothetical protein